MSHNRSYVLILLIQLIRWTITTNQNPFYTDYYQEMYQLFKEKHLNSITNEHKEKCLKKIEEEISKPSFSQIIEYSGKTFSDQGLRNQCSANGYSYILYFYNRNSSKDEHVLQLIRKRANFYGLCIYKECFEFLKGETGKTLLQNVLLPNSEVKEIYSVPAENTKIENYYAIIITCILSMFLLVKVLVWFFSILCEDEKRVIKYGLEASIGESLNDSSEQDSLMEQQEKAIPLFNTNQSKEQKEEDQKEENRVNIRRRVIDFLNIKQNINQLIEIKNQYYNDTNLELLSFIRMIALFFMVYNHNFYCLVHLPIKNMSGNEFFLSFKMMLLKMSTFSVNTWIVIEGFILAFKFMSYSKKIMIQNNSCVLPFKSLVFFYLKSMSKVITFIVVFLVISLGIEEFSFLNLPPMFNYFRFKLNPRQCTEKPVLMFKPFSLLYFDYIGQQFGFTNCYKYVNICYNTHLCFIFILIILYASMRFRSKIFDMVIVLLFFINVGLIKISSHFSYTLDITNTFSINYLYGETYSMKYTHLFINHYLIGVLGGIMHFYYVDVISQKPFYEINKNYNPFFFCFFMMKTIDSLSQVVKTIIVIICGCIMILVSIAFWCFYDRSTSDNPFIFNITPLYQFIDMYEKIFFVIAMMLMVLILLFSRNVSSFKAFYSSCLFRIIARISFPIFCSMDNMIYLFYSLYYIVIVLNYNNLFFISIGLMILLILINTLFIFTVDVPIRAFLCLLTNQNNKKKTEDEVRQIEKMKLDTIGVDSTITTKK